MKVLINDMDLRDISKKLEAELVKLFEELRSGIAAREDSRAFGAMIEQKIKRNWNSICSKCEFEPVAFPGKKTIYDFGFKVDGQLVGVDAKTKDIDSKKYSDGGICSVQNLLKFLANDQGQFIIAEFGHKRASQNKQNKKRELNYIRVAPFTLLPRRAYRIENLGTGQLRLDCTINAAWGEIEWSRKNEEFYDLFTELAIKHYQKVGRVAKQRIEKIKTFKNGGYTKFQFGR